MYRFTTFQFTFSLNNYVHATAVRNCTQVVIDSTDIFTINKEVLTVNNTYIFTCL